jgi:hypothetical protein
LAIPIIVPLAHNEHASCKKVSQLSTFQKSIRHKTKYLKLTKAQNGSRSAHGGDPFQLKKGAQL